jgi:HAD superfamily hydrolase (TIGR01509 family)
MKFEAVIFDFDGLMIESERVALRVWKEVVAALGSEMGDDVNQRLIGKEPNTGATIVRDVLELSIGVEELQKIYWKRRTVQMCQEAMPVDGLQELIHFLKGKNTRVGVASNSPSAYLERVLSAIRLRDQIDCVVGSDQVSAGKPAPDVYLATALVLGVKPGSCLALEDSPTGVTAAVQAGMICYAIPNPDLRGEDFSQAHQVFDSLQSMFLSLRDGQEC